MPSVTPVSDTFQKTSKRLTVYVGGVNFRLSLVQRATPHLRFGGITGMTSDLKIFGHSTDRSNDRRKLVRSLVVISMTALPVLAACSSSSSGGAAPKSTGSASTSGSSPIVIGGIIDATSFPGASEGFEARITAANKDGGIDGRQIKYIGSLDDGASTSTDLTDVQTQISKNHVAVVAPVISDGFDTASSTFAANNKTPFLGWGFLPDYCNNPWGWGFNGCLVSTDTYNTSLLQPIIKASGGDASSLRVALINNNNTAGSTDAKLFGGLWKKLGAQIVYNTQTLPPTGVTNYSSYVSAIMAAKPSIVEFNTTFAENIALAAALRGAGYKGKGLDFQTYVPGLLQSQKSVGAALEGEYVNTQVPPQEANQPATEQISTDLAAIGQPTTISLGNEVGYFTADVLVQMLKATAAAGAPMTGAGIESVVNGGFTYKGELAGGVGPNTFPASEAEAVPCAALLQVHNNAYKVVEPFDCYENLKVGS